MRKYLFWFSFSILLLSCNKNGSDPVEPIPRTKPQIKIPWPSLANSPWPMYKHDPQMTGRSEYEGPENGEIVWESEQSSTIYSSPVLNRDHVYYTTGILNTTVPGSLRAVDKNNGKEVWSVPTSPGESTTSPLVLSDGTIITGSSINKITAASSSGEILWEYNFPDSGKYYIQIASLIVDLESNIYFTIRQELSEGYNGILISLTKDGKERFRKTIPEPTLYIAFAPDGNYFYLALRFNGLQKYNIDGTLIWSLNENDTSYMKPMIDNDGNLYCWVANKTPDLGSYYIYSLNPDGTKRWRYKYSRYYGYGYTSMTMDHNGYIYLIHGPATVYSFYYNGELRWKKDYEVGDKMFGFNSEIICDKNGNLYFGSWLEKFLSIDFNGELKWEIKVDNTLGYIGYPPAIDDNKNLYLAFMGSWANIIKIK